MRYIGNGFITGIPARNLTGLEVRKFGKERLLLSGLYAEKQNTHNKELKNGKRNQSITSDTNQ